MPAAPRSGPWGPPISIPSCSFTWKGLADKLIAFLAVDKFKHHLEIPDLYPDQEALSYLGGRLLDELPGGTAGHRL